MARVQSRDLLTNAALAVAGVLVLVLLYGLVARSFSPRTTPTRDAPAEARAAEPGVDPIQVDVRNAASVDGLAREATRYLRRRGFDVVDMGNAPPREHSAVVVRAGTEAYARRVAAALSIDPERIESGGPPSDYDPDVTVYLGGDYRGLGPFTTYTPPDPSD